MKVYTKSGDQGTTALIGGERVAKDDIRVEAYGAVDELTAFIALLSDKIKASAPLSEFAAQLYSINSMLMNVEAHLAAGANIDFELPAISIEAIENLEMSIDKMQCEVPQIAKFTIPGGDEIVSLCHICRTVCRRAERRSITASRQTAINPLVTQYLNRLSDYLYLLGRVTTQRLEIEELLWRK